MSSPDEREDSEWLERARIVVAHHLGAEPSSVMRQSGGISNYVYRVLHRSGRFMVRLSPDASKLRVFRNEQLATQKVRAAGVPTAEVLLASDEAVGYPYAIQTWVRGEMAMHHPERLKILREMGRYGALINSIAMEGFGRDFTGLVTPPRASWREFLQQDLELGRRLEALVRQGMLEADKAERVRQILEAADQGARHGQLSHGDLRLKNVLADAQGNVTAIIDWEHAISALAPYWEWSIALHDLSIDAMQAFLEGYGASRESVERLAPVVKALNIVNYVPAIERCIKLGLQEPLGWIRMRLHGTFDMYSL